MDSEEIEKNNNLYIIIYSLKANAMYVLFVYNKYPLNHLPDHTIAHSVFPEGLLFIYYYFKI